MLSLQEDHKRLPVLLMLTFGAASGLVAQTATYPLDVVRRRMQVCVHSPRVCESIPVASVVLVPVLKAATVCIICRLQESAMCCATCLNTAGRKIVRQAVRSSSRPACLFQACPVTRLILVVTVCAQVQALQEHDPGRLQANNTWQGLRSIQRVQGWRGLFNGLSINYMKVWVLLQPHHDFAKMLNCRHIPADPPVGADSCSVKHQAVMSSTLGHDGVNTTWIALCAAAGGAQHGNWLHAVR